MQNIYLNCTIILFIAYLLAGCDSLLGEEQTEQPTPQPVASVTNGDVESNNESRQLVLWAPEAFSPDLETPDGRMLDPVIAQFEQAHPNIFLQIDIKAESGEANVLRYLRSAQQNAPSILPDLVLLDTQQLWQVVDLGLVQPLSDAETIYLVDMYPSAVDAITYQETSYGFPYAMDMMHLAYDRNSVKRLPQNWDDLLEDQATYLFQMGLFTDEKPHIFSRTSLLLLYLGAGGTLIESGTAENRETLEAVVEFLAQGQAQGIITEPTEESELADFVWSALSTGDFAYANISANTYLDRYAIFDNIGFSAIPAKRETQQSLVRVWAFAILTNDPEQRALALDFVQRLLEPNLHGPWSQFAHYIPSQRQAFATWGSNNAYYKFLLNEIENTVAIPNGPIFAEFVQRIQQAEQMFMSGEIMPEEALQKMLSLP